MEPADSELSVPGYGRFQLGSNSNFTDAVPKDGRAFPLHPTVEKPRAKSAKELHEQRLNSGLFYTFPIPEDVLQPTETEKQKLQQNHKRLSQEVRTMSQFPKRSSRGSESAEVDPEFPHHMHPRTLKSTEENARQVMLQEFGGGLSEIMVTEKDRLRQKRKAMQANAAQLVGSPATQKNRQRVDYASLSQSTEQCLQAQIRGGNARLEKGTLSANKLKGSNSTPSPKVPLPPCVSGSANGFIQNVTSSLHHQVMIVTKALEELRLEPGSVDVQTLGHALGVPPEAVPKKLDVMYETLSQLCGIPAAAAIGSSSSTSNSRTQNVGTEANVYANSAVGVSEATSSSSSSSSASVTGILQPQPNQQPTVLPSERGVPNRSNRSNGSTVVAPYAWLGQSSVPATPATRGSGRSHVQHSANSESQRQDHPLFSRRVVNRNTTSASSDRDWEISDFSYENLLELGSMAVTVGLTKQQLAKIPIFPFQQKARTTEYKECSICLEAFCDGEQCLTLRCHHTFHKNCAYRWLLKNHYCPFCRQDVTRAPQAHS